MKQNEVIKIRSKSIVISILLLSIIAIGISVVIFVFPSVFELYNKNLSNVKNVISFLGLIFSAGALLIASLAYIEAILEPKLNLTIIPWLATEIGPALNINKETNLVDYTRPLTSWHLYLHNKGKISANNVVVKIIFKNAYFLENQFDGWRGTEHANAFGWYGFQWVPGPAESSIVHPDFDIELPTMDFSDLGVKGLEEIEIIIAADRMKAKRYRKSVKLHYPY